MQPEGLGIASHKGQTRKNLYQVSFRSALQTHLQGLDGTTLPVEPEEIIAHVTLLSSSNNDRFIQPET
jgi:hypothetical protein